jgi:hypothetical protein
VTTPAGPVISRFPLDARVELDAVLPRYPRREPQPRWVELSHDHLTGEEWRSVLRACQAAVHTARDGLGPRTVARAATVELTTSPHHVRIAVAAVLTSQGAKQHVLIDLDAYWAELEAADRHAVELRSRRPTRRPLRNRCGPLPVDAARAVPILTLLERYGIACRRVGREHVGRCPFGNHRRPHLTVNVQKGLWHCWPCDLGGDGIAFVQRLKGLEFAGAVRELVA